MSWDGIRKRARKVKKKMGLDNYCRRCNRKITDDDLEIIFCDDCLEILHMAEKLFQNKHVTGCNCPKCIDLVLEELAMEGKIKKVGPHTWEPVERTTGNGDE